MTARKTRASSPARTATYQTRISDFGGMDRTTGDGLLSAYAELYCKIQRRLFAQVAAGRPAAVLKGEYLRSYRIPARMFNAIRVSLEGKVASVREQQLLRRDELKRRIARAQGQIDQAGDGPRRDWLHQKRRRLGNLNTKLEKLESDIESGRIRLCFGSRRLWRKQHALGANGYSNHAEWLKDWQTARSDEFFVMGSRDETGAASCAWPRLMMTGLLPCGSGCPTPLGESRASTWSFLN